MQSSEHPEVKRRHCDVHGDYEAKLIDSLFGDRGFYTPCQQCAEARKAEELERKEQALQRDEQRRIDCLRSSSGIPHRFQGKRFAQYVAQTGGQRNALNVCQRYAAKLQDTTKGGESLLLIGRPGTGKTHLATSIAHELIDSGCRALYSTANEIARRVRNTYAARAEESEEDVFEDLNRTALLIVDEIATTQQSEHALRVLFEIVDWRYRECRPLILISNLNAEELKAAIGERIVDRMSEIAATVAFDWRSQRAA